MTKFSIASRRTLFREVKELLVGRGGETRRLWRLAQLADEATNYIRDVVWNLVSREPSRTDHLGGWRMRAAMRRPER
jgi:hypothetical protein